MDILSAVQSSCHRSLCTHPSGTDMNILSAVQSSCHRSSGTDPSGNDMVILSAVQSFCQRYSGTDPSGTVHIVADLSDKDLQIQFLWLHVRYFKCSTVLLCI